MKNLVIIAAGGCGREVLQWAKDINEKENRWNIKGFLDDNLNALIGLKCDVPILETIDDYEIQPDDEFICCIGNSNVRKMVVEKLRAKGAVFATLVHPNAVIADSCTLGEGVIIYPYALISDNAVIGNQCIINMYSSVAHDLRWVSIARSVRIATLRECVSWETVCSWVQHQIWCRAARLEMMCISVREAP